MAPLLLLLLLAASPAATTRHADDEPDPVIGWPRSPLAHLPALPKTHISWGLAGVPYNTSSPTVRDFARITHSLPIRVPLHGDSATFAEDGTDAVQIEQAVKICADTNASLNLNWSPWWARPLAYDCSRLAASRRGALHTTAPAGLR